MTQADRVLSTPPTNTPTASAPGAVQLSSPPVILTSHAHAGQGVKNEPEPSRGSAIQEGGAAVSRRFFVNSIVSLPIAAVVPVATPSIAAPPMSDKPSRPEAELARFEQAVNVLRTRHVCEGWTMDEAAAERALSYFRKGCPDDEEWGATLYFIASHGLSFEWIHFGDPSVMIAQGASLSRQAAARGTDPIYAAIEAHKAARETTLAEVARYAELERQLQACGRLETAKRHEDERRRGEEIEADIEEAHEAEADAACDLLSVTPTTIAGVVALLAHARDYDIDGMGFPSHVVDGNWRAGHSADCVEDTRSWQYFLISNLVEVLPELMAGRA
jgi:hypothetical protein